MLNVVERDDNIEAAAADDDQLAIFSRMRFSGTILMSPEEWATIADNPRQRDTERHAKRAEHLRVPHPAHSRVNMARLPDGSRIKLDGHTRSYLWAKGEVPAPPSLHVDIWDCASAADAADLYSTFDAAGATETTVDQMFGAFRQGKLEFKSELLSSLRFAGGMRGAYELLYGQIPARRASIFQLLKYWLPELRLIDACDGTRRVFVSGVFTAALLIFRRHGPAATDFWVAYANRAGTKIGKEMDGVQALAERIERRRREKRLSGRANVQEVVSLAIPAFDRYRADEMYSLDSSGIKTLRADTLRKWLAATKATRRRGW